MRIFQNLSFLEFSSSISKEWPFSQIHPPPWVWRSSNQTSYNNNVLLCWEEEGNVYLVNRDISLTWPVSMISHLSHNHVFHVTESYAEVDILISIFLCVLTTWKERSLSFPSQSPLHIVTNLVLNRMIF